MQANQSAGTGRRRQRVKIVTPSEPMSPTDLAWFEMDSDRNPMVVSAVFELEGVRSLPRLIATLSRRVQQHPRFRQRADDTCRPALWLGVDEIDERYHFRQRRLGGADPAQQLRLYVAHELASPLDRERPLWRMSFFSGARAGHVTLLYRAHHAMADGVSLLRLLLKLADGAASLDVTAALPAPALSPHRGPLAPVIHGLEQLNQALASMQAAARSAAAEPLKTLSLGARGVAAVALTARMLGRGARNPPSMLLPVSGQRAVDWSTPLPIEPLRELARREGITLNDLFLATLAGALGHYLLEAGELPRGQNLRVSLPVNLRAADDERLGNCFGLVLLDLPVGEPSRRRRYRLISQRMAALKHSPEARTTLAMLDAAGHLPVMAQKRLVSWVSGKAAAVVSNLRGPDKPLHFAGARLASAVFWPPQTGNVGIGISLLSYAGQLTLGLSCDIGVLVRPHRVVAAFTAEIDQALSAGHGTSAQTPEAS